MVQVWLVIFVLKNLTPVKKHRLNRHYVFCPNVGCPTVDFRTRQYPDQSIGLNTFPYQFIEM